MGLFRALRGLFAGGAGRAAALYDPPPPPPQPVLRPAESRTRCAGEDHSGTGAGVDWAEVRRLYEESEVPIKAILARFRLSRAELRQARLDGGWRLRPQVATPGPRQGQRRHSPKDLTRRLLRVAGERLTRLEAAAAAGAAAGPSAEELKAMAELARALPALIREDRLLGGASGEAESEAEPAKTAEQTREEAERARKEAFREADAEYMRAQLTREVEILLDHFRWHHERGEGEAFLDGLRDRERELLMIACGERPKARENWGKAAAT
jgi:hypothetical protein